MAYTLTKLAPRKGDLTPKNRVWEIFSESNNSRPRNRRQVQQLHRKNRPTPTKTVSGIPVWPSRDPIEEEGGINLYGFVGNNGVNGWDILGLKIWSEDHETHGSIAVFTSYTATVTLTYDSTECKVTAGSPQLTGVSWLTSNTADVVVDHDSEETFTITCKNDKGETGKRKVKKGFYRVRHYIVIGVWKTGYRYLSHTNYIPYQIECDCDCSEK